MFKSFFVYVLRWQLSTPILALCLIWLGGLGEIPATILANLIGAIIFFPVDKFIFSRSVKNESDKDLPTLSLNK